MKISAFIITLNAEKKFEDCLGSLSWVDEIIVVDSGSTDRTLELAKKYGCKIFNRPFIDFSDQKNHALSLCKGDWLLSIDSDEVVTDSLKDEILQAVMQTDSCEGYRIPRHSVIFGREFRFSGTQNDCPIRFFKSGYGQFVQPIHEFLEIRGKSGIFKGHLMHFTYLNVAEYFIRFERYTSAEAAYLLEKKHPLSWIDFALRPPVMFFKLYFLKQGFRDGWAGFLFCFFSARYVFVKYSKYQILRKAKSSE